MSYNNTITLDSNKYKASWVVTDEVFEEVALLLTEFERLNKDVN